MNAFVVQMFSSDLIGMALTAALVAGGILLLGGLISFAVCGYRSIRGDGMRDPREVAPEKVNDDDDELSEGGSDDEWDYY